MSIQFIGCAAEESLCNDCGRPLGHSDHDTFGSCSFVVDIAIIVISSATFATEAAKRYGDGKYMKMYAMRSAKLDQQERQ